MPDLLSGKPLAAVRLEGTITDKDDVVGFDIGKVRPGVLEAMAELRKTHFVTVVSALTSLSTTIGSAVALKFLADNAVPYDELWYSYGVPNADVWYDAKSRTVADLLGEAPLRGPVG